MKASDSTNSLTELTEVKTCFICLESEPNEKGEPLVDSKLLRNCGCRFYVHPACWNEWLKEKSDYDCPICHKSSMLRIKIPPNPVLSVVYQEEYQDPRRNRYWKGCVCLFFTAVAIILVVAITKWG
jgi:hypothetical protein